VARLPIRILPGFFVAAMLFAQSGGLKPEWEVRKTLQDVSVKIQRLGPYLSQVKPQEWLAKGAPDAYVKQHKLCQDELGYLLRAVDALAARPEKLPVALEAYFRMEALEKMVDSLSNGIRKYQNAALAELIGGVMSESFSGRDQLRQYIQELAESKDKEFQIVDSEAQRCRGTVSQQPPSPIRQEKTRVVPK